MELVEIILWDTKNCTSGVAHDTRVALCPRWADVTFSRRYELSTEKGDKLSSVASVWANR